MERETTLLKKKPFDRKESHCKDKKNPVTFVTLLASSFMNQVFLNDILQWSVHNHNFEVNSMWVCMDCDLVVTSDHLRKVSLYALKHYRMQTLSGQYESLQHRNTHKR